MNIVFKAQSKLDETFTRMLALRFREDIDKKLLSPKFSPDLLCIQQSYAAFFCETYTKLYFQLNQIEKELTLNRKRWNYWCLFFSGKNLRLLVNMWRCPNFLYEALVTLSWFWSFSNGVRDFGWIHENPWKFVKIFF